MKKKNLNKNDIAEFIRLEYDITKTTSRSLVNEVFNFLETQLKNGQTITVTGFGKFYVKPNLRLNNQMHGKKYNKKAKYTVKFSASSKFNKNYRKGEINE
ncbi:hypothetical protein S100390_v1c03960 [Spiroplasma sp. NBRC 100390]|uniref:HU family DNA-binding protein n=1 Tax=unclassified Spiroplasma TaxID=2637901 RepID=UPI00089288C2|nr:MULTISPECIES: HU family DNA-binding protein [unclassified Spiroplasma]AOX43739.1 hypothetical protein STU14_v1c03960 [Spiroplasma sp. TU-14]APE13209.1 hypothetical protein S100390_v1c03960 [Spiroplasma sp. NBRC 100390]